MAAIREETEYRERWEYVKHSETIRYRAVGWYFTVVGALLAVAYTGKLEVDPQMARPVILVFLTLYTVATSFFLVGLKLSYREHVDQIRSLDGIGSAHRDKGGGAFSFYLYSLAVVGSALAFAAVVEIERGAVWNLPGREAGLWAAGGVFGLIVVFNVWKLREWSLAAALKKLGEFGRVGLR